MNEMFNHTQISFPFYSNSSAERKQAKGRWPFRGIGQVWMLSSLLKFLLVQLAVFAWLLHRCDILSIIALYSVSILVLKIYFSLYFAVYYFSCVITCSISFFFSLIFRHFTFSLATCFKTTIHYDNISLHISLTPVLFCLLSHSLILLLIWSYLRLTSTNDPASFLSRFSFSCVRVASFTFRCGSALGPFSAVFAE